MANNKQCYLEDMKEARDRQRSLARWKHGMHQKDVCEFMSQFSHCFLGAYSQRDLVEDQSLLKEVMKRLEADQPLSLMVSTNYEDRETPPGEQTHWVCLYMDGQGECDYFDSYGIPPIQKDILQFLDCAREGAGCVHANQTELQDIWDQDSRTCGFHCVYYLMNREFKGYKADEIYRTYPNNGRNTHSNDVHATLFCENLIK